MMMSHTVALAMVSALILATPALARDRHKADDTPCDAEGAFDGGQELVVFRVSGPDTFEDQRARADGQQAAPDADADADDGDSADDPDADSDDDGADSNGCAEIMVTPYDLMIHAPDRAPLPVVLRREHQVARKPELI